jgi:hypothetical protein
MEWDRGEKGIELLHHHHPLPSMEGALGTWEALEAPLKVSVENPDSLKI